MFFYRIWFYYYIFHFVFHITHGVNVKEVTLPFEHMVEISNINQNTNISIDMEVANQNFIVGTDWLNAKH